MSMQESKLSNQMKKLSCSMHKHEVAPTQQAFDWKSNVMYGVDESPPKTPKNTLIPYIYNNNDTLHNMYS